MCWGQQYVWLNHHHLPLGAKHELNISLSYEPPAGSTVDTLRTALDALVRRHEALRTTLHWEGTDGPVQRVSPPMSVPLVLREAGPGSARPADVINEQIAAQFRLDEEWPFRACVITSGQVPRMLVVTGNHVAVDDWSLEAIKREFHELHTAVLAHRPVNLPPVRQHPVDLARYEATAPARRVHRQAMEHWSAVLERIPADLFGRRRRDVAGAYSASLSSPAAVAAARRLAARYQTWPSLVCTAAYTALMAAYTASDRVFFTTYAGNRDSRQHADLLTCLFQPVIVDVPCDDGPTFDELVQRTTDRAGQALTHSYSSYDEAVTLVARHSAERGLPLRVANAFNYIQRGATSRGGTRTLLTWNAEPVNWAHLENDSYLRVHEWQDSLTATLSVRASVMDREDVVRFLRGLERLLVTQADDETPLRLADVAALAGFDTPPAHPPDTVTVDRTPVSPSAVAGCLAAVPGVVSAAAFAADGELTGYVFATDPAVTPAVLRGHVLAAMYDLDRVRCPDRFVVCRQAPADPDDAGSWAAVDAALTGDGRDGPARAPMHETEHLLYESVRAVNGLSGVDLARSYVEAGGRVLNIPRVLELLRQSGWVGPSVYDLASARPLAAVAAAFVPQPQ
ncbi:condensation domain-containing protein [Micromonospora sp. DT31]|uniref:condensation domain-containing protein n=1 Tax=Micromonospora sp. DT31 TaxID=3393434 RepID=UPI003CF32D99